MIKEIQLKEPIIYFLIKNKEIIYIGESDIGIKRIFEHRATKDFDTAKYISSNYLKFLDNNLFRKYYEARLIKFFKPKENKSSTNIPELNTFLLKMFLWKENPTADFIKPLSNLVDFMKYDYLETKVKDTYKIKKVQNKYTKVWKELNLQNKLYVNKQNAFKFLAFEQYQPHKNPNKFVPRLESLHNEL
jgi:hypothetical protein